MATATKSEDQDSGGEYACPDAEAAFKIYDAEIKPKKAHISTLTGDLSDPFARIKDKCHFPRNILDFISGLEGMEDAKRDHNLLALSEGLRVRKLFLPRDLVTLASGEAGGEIVAETKRARPKLVTIPSDDSDLADPSGKEPQSGTGAAAMAAMRAADAAEFDKAEV